MTAGERLLAEMIETVERIKRDYPDVPERFDMGADIWWALKVGLPVVHREGFPVFRGTPILLRPDLKPWEWGPVFRARVPL